MRPGSRFLHPEAIADACAKMGLTLELVCGAEDLDFDYSNLGMPDRSRLCGFKAANGTI
jgi:hypothetical protein